MYGNPYSNFVNNNSNSLTEEIKERYNINQLKYKNEEKGVINPGL